MKKMVSDRVKEIPSNENRANRVATVLIPRVLRGYEIGIIENNKYQIKSTIIKCNPDRAR